MSFSSAAKFGAKVIGLGLYAGAVYLGTNAVLAPVFNKKSEIETIWEKAKDRYNTYQELEKEGIKAASFEEAKQKLDSIKEDRLYREYGIVPPSAGDSEFEKVTKVLELSKKLSEDNSAMDSILKLIDEIKSENEKQGFVIDTNN